MSQLKNQTFEEKLQAMVAEIVDARLSAGLAREDAMVSRYGEYVKMSEAARIMGITMSTLYKLRDAGMIEAVPHVGISVRSIANMPTVARKAPQEVRRGANKAANFIKIAP